MSFDALADDILPLKIQLYVGTNSTCSRTERTVSFSIWSDQKDCDSFHYEKFSKRVNEQLRVKYRLTKMQGGYTGNKTTIENADAVVKAFQGLGFKVSRGNGSARVDGILRTSDALAAFVEFLEPL